MNSPLLSMVPRHQQAPKPSDRARWALTTMTTTLVRHGYTRLPVHTQDLTIIDHLMGRLT